MKYILTPILLVSLIISNIFAQQLIEEKTVYLPGLLEDGEDIHATSDGGFLATASCVDLDGTKCYEALIKLDQNGDTLWTKIFTDSLHAGASTTYSFTADDGILYMLDFTFSNAPKPGYDFEIRKYDANGSLTFTKTMNESDFNATPQAINDPQIIENPNGGYIIAADYQPLLVPTIYFGFSVVKLNASLDTVWTRTYVAGDNSYMEKVKLAGNGDILIGYNNYTNLSYLGMLRLSGTGDSLWLKTYPGNSENSMYDFTEDPNGNIFVCGDNYVDTTKYETTFLKIDANGSEVFAKTYWNGNNNGANSLILTADGGAIIAGVVVKPNEDFYDYLIKVDAAGNLVWDATFLSDQQNYWTYFEGVAISTDGNLIAYGSKYDQVTEDSEVYIVTFKDNNGATSIANASALAPIKVYPTLASSLNDIKVELPANETFTLEVFNLNGQLLWNQEQATGTVVLNAGKVTPGQYLVRATSKSIRFTQKVVVK